MEVYVARVVVVAVEDLPLLRENQRAGWMPVPRASTPPLLIVTMSQTASPTHRLRLQGVDYQGPIPRNKVDQDSVLEFMLMIPQAHTPPMKSLMPYVKFILSIVEVGGMANFFGDMFEFSSSPLYMIDLFFRKDNQYIFF